MTSVNLSSAPATPSSASRRNAFLRRNSPLLLIYGLLLVMIVVGTVVGERFFTERNLFNILRQAAFLGTVSIGQTLVILAGGIDLSVGSVVKLSMLVAAILNDGQAGQTWLAVVATLSLGALIGFVHATIITRFKVAPFIVTLGTYSILRGIALTVATKPVGRASSGLLRLYDIKIGPVPVLVVLFALLVIGIYFMLRQTTFGRYIYAVGGDEQTARLSGINITWVRYGVYMGCSTLAALTGLLYLSRMGIGDPVVGDGLELQSITAVILGGTSLFGGRGGVVGTLGGVLLLGLTNNLLVVLKINQWVQDLIEGLVIVGAVALYRQKGRQ